MVTTNCWKKINGINSFVESVAVLRFPHQPSKLFQYPYTAESSDKNSSLPFLGTPVKNETTSTLEGLLLELEAIIIERTNCFFNYITQNIKNKINGLLTTISSSSEANRCATYQIEAVLNRVGINCKTTYNITIAVPEETLQLILSKNSFALVFLGINILQFLQLV